MGFWGKIGGFFKGVAVFLKDAIVGFLKSDAVKDVLKTAEGKIINAIVVELSLSNLSNAEKRAEALARSKAAIVAAGLEAKDSWLNLVIELAVNVLKTTTK
jgi:energy-converting hydrogenase Eha subunit B